MSALQLLTELTGISSPMLGDEQALAALTVAAGAALGLTPHGPPLSRTGPRGIAVGLLGHGGHIVLHAEPASGICLVDIVSPAGVLPARALEVITRRLGVRNPASA
jgi:S-adenosylmethionine/arginine decarboxylase-like enzyme